MSTMCMYTRHSRFFLLYFFAVKKLLSTRPLFLGHCSPVTGTNYLEFDQIAPETGLQFVLEKRLLYMLWKLGVVSFLSPVLCRNCRP